MNRYLLDANVIAGDFRFRHNATRLLLREAREGRIGLLVPQVAVDEAVNKYREELETPHREWQRASKRLRGLGAIDESEVTHALDLQAIEANFRQELTEKLTSARAEILPYPSVSHETVVRRALARERPFDAEGKHGYRDTLIWETVLEHVDEEKPIVIVSADNRAFSGKGQTDLFPGLVEELEARGLDPECVQRIPHVSVFTETLPTTARFELEIESALSEPGEVRDTFEEGVAEEFFDWDQDQPQDLQLDAPLEVDYVYLDVVNEVRNPHLRSARELDDAKVAVEVEVEVDASLQVLVWKYDAVGYTGSDVRFTNYDYNESFAEGNVDRVLLAEVEARYDPSSKTLEWVMPYNVLSITPPSE